MAGLVVAMVGGCSGESSHAALDGVTVTASRYTGYRFVSSSTTTRDAAIHLCSDGELPSGVECDWRYVIAQEPPVWGDAVAVALWEAARERPDAYAVFTKASAARTESVVVLGPTTPERYGTSAIANGNTPDTAHTIAAPTAIVDWGSLPLRGIVEGFYGKPYAPEERARVLRCLASLKSNTYFYAPKGDPFVHSKWREPYPPEMATHLRMLADFSRRHGIRFVWGIAPGAVDDLKQAITFSSAPDRAALFTKIDTMRALGITDFALLFDDSAVMLNGADQTKVASPADAHAQLANELQAYLAATNADARLLFVGLAYSELYEGWTRYTDVLGATLDPRVDVMWTGPNTFSQTLAASDFDSVTASLRRKPVVWDNYPSEPIKPVDRARDLPRGVAGFLSNPMLNELSYRPLDDFLAVFGPLSRYMWNADSDLVASYDEWNGGVLAATCGSE